MERLYGDVQANVEKLPDVTFWLGPHREIDVLEFSQSSTPLWLRRFTT